MDPRRDRDRPIDLESSSVDEMDRVIGCDANGRVIDTPAGTIHEPHHLRAPSSELMRQPFLGQSWDN